MKKNPNKMTPDERLREIACIFARGNPSDGRGEQSYCPTLQPSNPCQTCKSSPQNLQTRPLQTSEPNHSQVCRTRPLQAAGINPTAGQGVAAVV